MHRNVLISQHLSRWILQCSGERYSIPGKGKDRPITCCQGTEGRYRCNSTLSLTSLLNGSGWLTLGPRRFTPWKEAWCKLYRRLGGLQGRFGRVQEISPPPPRFDPRTILSVARRSYPGPHSIPRQSIWELVMSKVAKGHCDSFLSPMSINSHHFSPVVHSLRRRIMLVMEVVFKWNN